MGIVKGFTDVLNPVNLAINGQFHINQRGLFTGGYAAAKVNDYVSDCWQVNTGTNVDYLEVYNDISLNLLKVKGYGKKGQYVDLYNSKAWDNIYRIRSMTRAVETTASFVLRHIAGVPIQGRAVPMQLTGNTSVYEYQPKLKNPSFDKPVSIKTNPVNVSGSSSYGQALVYLLSDGAFEFAVSDFVNVTGAYVNPPTVAPVSRAEEIIRCKRFYQKGTVTGSMPIVLPVEMAGTPSIGVAFSGINYGGAAADGSDVIPIAVSPRNSKEFSAVQRANIVADASGSMDRYIGSAYSPRIITIAYGATGSSPNMIYHTYCCFGNATNKNQMVLLNTTNVGTVGTRTLSVDTVNSTMNKIAAITWAGGSAGDRILISVSNDNREFNDNGFIWEATV